ncbi:hypothetical protein CRUP_026881 [Coryphaenoides rupestris]|nr:hypothetical protein CRUP_026881 [Coryphaenoides rupestris]
MGPPTSDGPSPALLWTHAAPATPSADFPGRDCFGKKINRVACGSAHTLAWSTSKPTNAGKLPSQVPMEYNHLQEIPILGLRNRLLLLHHISELFCPCIPMFHLEGRLGQPGHGPSVGFDALRGILISQGKEAAFRKVVQATMVRDRQHGPVVELNRIQVKRSRSKGGLAGPDGTKSVLGQMCSKMSSFSPDSLLLPHRVWKVKFVGESVDDCGGGYSESIAEMCEELQNGLTPLLIVTPNGRDESGANRDCFLLNPAAKSPLHMNMFRFLVVIYSRPSAYYFPIQRNIKYNPPDHFLPESYTCFFLLKLPRYSCRQVLEEKLKYAIHFCKSIDTDDYARIALSGEPAADDSSEDSDNEDADSFASDSTQDYLTGH